jgi:alpha-glucosidase/alpha-D-xyloside xylohydrolase
LPAGKWWDYWTGTGVEGGGVVARDVDLETMPLYVKAGAIVPMSPVRQYTGEPVAEPVSLRIYPGADGQSTWYVDDGSSYRYEMGEFMRMHCAWNDRDRTLALTPDPAGRQKLPEVIRVEFFDGSSSKLVKPLRDGIRVKL